MTLSEDPHKSHSTHCSCFYQICPAYIISLFWSDIAFIMSVSTDTPQQQ